MTPFLPAMSALLLTLTLPAMSALLVGKFVLPMLPGTASAAVLEVAFMLVLAVLEVAFLAALPVLLLTAVAKAHGAPSPAKSR